MTKLSDTKYLTFSERLASRRIELQISQSELSRLSNIAVAQISRYESRRTKPRKDIISRLAQALNVDYKWLTGDSDEIQITFRPIPRITDRNSDKFMLRLPPGLRAQIAEDAALNGRSMNAEIVARCCSTEKDIPTDKLIKELADRIDGKITITINED